MLPAGFGGQADGTEPRVAPRGKRVQFSSLNADDTTTLWVRNRTLETTTRVDTGITGRGAVGSWSMSASGRYVAFVTDQALVAADTNGEVDAYRVDRQSGQKLLLSVGSSGQQGNSSSNTVELPADGLHVAFGSFASNLVASDTNDDPDVFVWDGGPLD